MHIDLRDLLRRTLLVAIIVGLAARLSHAQTEASPTLDGYVTKVVSSAEFEVNGYRVIGSDKTHYYLRSGNTRASVAIADLKPYVGQVAQVYGKRQNHARAVDATEVRLRSREPRAVSGSGIIDALVSDPGGSTGDYIVRADGYTVRVSPNTRTVFTAPLTETSSYRVNVWMTFHGTQGADGVVIAETATFRENRISSSEDDLRKKKEYDPAAVDPNSKQSGLSKAFQGINPKLIPPHQDPTMQARVNVIGAKVVPKYQRDLPDTDETKINFRFQLIDQKKWHDGLALPNGIILLPYQVVERTQNDSQLAAVLADHVARVIEKQALNLRLAHRKMTFAQLVACGGGILVPGLGIATSAASGVVDDKLQRRNEEQSGRVSLVLMRDAGYDINEAPIAWWRLDSTYEPLDTPLPRRTAYLYKILGETWHSQ